MSLDYRDKLVLLQTLEYIQEVDTTLKRFGLEFETFIEDFVYKNSVSMSAMQIGELKNSLSDEFIEKYGSYFDWDSLRKLRNQFAHAYARIDEEIIWDFATRKAPELEEVINRVLLEDRKQEK
ncbi:MAG: DUF86 domain-containing protein [Streptococcaceae bacterium]|nr:DUF86 domain-containing protein [Streptococcaceae bacterium]